MAVPEYFEALVYEDSVLQHIGSQFHVCDQALTTKAFLADEKHCNARGIVHGGVLAFYEEPPLHRVTASLTTDLQAWPMPVILSKRRTR